MNSLRQHQKGLSLIELMVAVTVGLVVLAGVTQLFITTLTGSRDLLNEARLENELNGILLWMSDDIRPCWLLG